ncbi:MAG TPA: YIP1 family protein [Phycisphaerae bacterium]|nr:YIP1 family protein [Phycisphaerae bacterium]
MSAVQPNASSLGLGQVPLMFVAPRRVFHRIAETGRYGWALGALILVTTLIGWVTMQTGLIDREVNRRTLQALADLEREQIDLLSRSELSERLDRIRKSAEFTKLIVRGSAVVVAPLALIASVALIAAILFAVVALTGNKPDYPTLMAVCVYAAVVDVLAAALRLAMMLYYRTMQVDTSLGLLVPTSEGTQTVKTILSAVDPFRVWFWLLVGLGLVLTGQLSRRAAVITCVLFCLIAVGARMIPTDAGWPSG